MELLLDDCVPERLAREFVPHNVTIAQRIGWKGLKNGKLLAQAEANFDVLITTDTNIYHQQVVAEFSIAVIVLRAFKNRYIDLLPCVSDALDALEVIQPGQVIYLYADERLRESDQKKGKGQFKAEIEPE